MIIQMISPAMRTPEHCKGFELCWFIVRLIYYCLIATIHLIWFASKSFFRFSFQIAQTLLKIFRSSSSRDSFECTVWTWEVGVWSLTFALTLPIASMELNRRFWSKFYLNLYLKPLMQTMADESNDDLYYRSVVPDSFQILFKFCSNSVSTWTASKQFREFSEAPRGHYQDRELGRQLNDPIDSITKIFTLFYQNWECSNFMIFMTLFSELLFRSICWFGAVALHRVFNESLTNLTTFLRILASLPSLLWFRLQNLEL